MSDVRVFETNDAVELYVFLSTIFLQKNITFNVRSARGGVNLEFVFCRSDDLLFIRDTVPAGLLDDSNPETLVVTIPANHILQRRQPAVTFLSFVKRVLVVFLLFGLLVLGYFFFVTGI